MKVIRFAARVFWLGLAIAFSVMKYPGAAIGCIVMAQLISMEAKL